MRFNFSKRVVSVLLLSVFLGSTLFGINLITPVKAEAPPPLPSTLIFQDDFEDYAVGSFPSAGGWAIRFDGSGNNKIVDTVSVSPTKSFQLQGGPWGGSVSEVRVRIDDKCQLLYFQAYVRVKSPITAHSGGWLGFTHWTSSPDVQAGRALIEFFNDGIIYAGSDDEIKYALQSYVVDTWYKAEILLNKTTDEYWVWIDDHYMGEFRTYSSSIDVDSFTLGAGKDNSIVYFDDVKIFGEIPNNPTARFTASTLFPYINETVIFIASDSLPGWNGTHSMPIVSYEWDFGDNSIGTGVTATHTYTAEGTYTVMLNVTDSQGLWHISSKTVTVSPEPPPPPFLVDMYDDFNDNSINTTFWDNHEYGCARVYEQNGRLEVSGVGGGTGGLVTKEAHDLTTVDIQVDVHNTGRLSQGLGFADEKQTNDSARNSNEMYWICKINRDNSLQITRQINKVEEVLYCAPWTSATGTLRIFISDGTIRFYEDEIERYREPYQLSTYNCYIYITTYAPSAGQWDYFDNFKLYGVPRSPGGPIAKFGYSPTSPYVNDAITFDASASLPGWNDTHRLPIVSYVWDFGDNSIGTGVTATHTYATEGTYTVTLNVTDSQGLWDTVSETVIVLPLPPPLPGLATVSVYPPRITGPPPRVGDTFKSYIKIENVTDLYTWSIGLSWNSSVLKCTGVTYKYGFFGPQGSVITIAGTINNTLGTIYPPYAASLTGPAGVTGSGLLLEVEFRVLANASTHLNLTVYTLVDSNGEDISFNVVNGYFDDPPVRLLGDVNADGKVNTVDLFYFARSWYKTVDDPHYPPVLGGYDYRADFNMDGKVDTYDLYYLGRNWNKGTS